MLVYKGDWKEARGLFKQWWEGELERGPLLQVISPRKGVSRWRGWNSWTVLRYRNNPSRIVKSFESWCSMTFFGGVAFPNLWINFGPGVLGAFLGATPKFTGNTVWFGAAWNKKISKSLDEISELEIDQRNEWWRSLIQVTLEVSKSATGRYIVGMTDIGGVLDVIASLRGSLKLIKDMFYRPNEVERAIWHVLDLWHWCYNKLTDLIGQEGTSAWMGLWCPQNWYPIQCDFAALLSPKLFQRFVLPHIDEQCKRLDFTIYHLDGPRQIPHLEMLLQIEELTGIQWVPGASMDARGYGCGSSVWFPIYRKILSVGKRLVIQVPPREIKTLLKELPSHELILIQTYCQTQSEAKRFLSSFEKIRA